MSERTALDDRFIEAVRAVWSTEKFTLTEVGKIFNIHRNTVARYVGRY